MSMSTIEEEQHHTQTFFNVATDPSLIVSICTHNYILVFSSESQPALQQFIAAHIHNSTYKIDPASFGPAVKHSTYNLKRTARVFSGVLPFPLRACAAMFLIGGTHARAVKYLSLIHI